MDVAGRVVEIAIDLLAGTVEVDLRLCRLDMRWPAAPPSPRSPLRPRYQPTAAAASMAAPRAAASLTGETDSGRSSTVAMICSSSCELVPPPAAVIGVCPQPIRRFHRLRGDRLLEGDAFQHRSKQMGAAVVERQADDRAARRTVPIRAHHARPIGHDKQSVGCRPRSRPLPSRAQRPRPSRWSARSSRPVACRSAAPSPA